MKRTRLSALLAGLALAVGMVSPAQAADEPAPVVEALWDASYSPLATDEDCAWFDADGNGFCVADDPGGVELGVRFQATEPVLIGGVRLYRADAGEVTATLWSPDGQPMAQAVVPPVEGGFAHGWQDATFDSPVVVSPGTTYIVSYYSPNARYAFEHGYFSDSAYQSGPLVALQSVAGSGNGVFCYGDPSCYPGETFLDSNYWVSPLLWHYDFAGFGAHADGATVEAKAGRAIPVEFSLGGDYGLDIFADGYPKMRPISCDPSVTLETLDDDPSADTAGNSGLTYNPDTGQYKYVWKTPKKAAGDCFAFRIGLDDATVHTLNVHFVR